MTDFYLTLPSNVNGAVNTTAHYRTELPQTIDLYGEWRVALTEIQYPYSWNNVGFNSAADGMIVIRIYDEDKPTAVNIELTDYPDIQTLVTSISKAIKRRGGEMCQMLEVDGTDIHDALTIDEVPVQDLAHWQH